MKKFLVATCLSTSFLGCTSSFIVSPQADSLSINYRAFNESLHGKNAVISFKDGRELKASNISVLADTTKSSRTLDSTKNRLPLSEVARIEATNHGKGGWDGLGIGALTGTAAGLAILYSINASASHSDPPTTTGIAFMGGSGVLFGGIFGSLAGYSMGHSDVYTMKNPEDAQKTRMITFDIDSIQEPQNSIMIEVAGFPHLASETGSWYARLGLRGGYGFDVAGLFGVRAFVEYYEFAFDPHGGMSYSVYSEGHRRDYALYGSVVAFTFLEMAAGICYSHQDEVIHRDGWLTGPQTITIVPSVNEFRPYFHMGLTGSIHFLEPIDLPLGMIYRDQVGIGFRTGVLIRF